MSATEPVSLLAGIRPVQPFPDHGDVEQRCDLHGKGALVVVFAIQRASNHSGHILSTSLIILIRARVANLGSP